MIRISFARIGQISCSACGKPPAAEGLKHEDRRRRPRVLALKGIFFDADC